MKTKKKGFTIVELVIVIAVIAVLAAVLIPTFSSIIKKANRSADVQAVNQMNKYLAIEEVTADMDINDVYGALAEGGMSAKNYRPLTSNTYFFWVKSLNRIVYTDNDYKVIYPSEYEGKAIDSFESVYLSLGGNIKQEKVEVNGGIATVSTAEQLYYLSEKYRTSAIDLTEIKLSGNKIDLKGANVAFTVPAGKSLTVTGADGGTKLTGLVTMDSKLYLEKAGKDYASGFIANVEKGTDAQKTELVIKNVTIDNATVGGLEIGGVGALIGRINDGTKVTVENCKVIDTVVNGKNKVGALIGSVASCELEIKNCLVENCTVNCSEGESAMVIGNAYNSTKITIDKSFGEWVKGNTTLNLVSTENRTVETDMTKLSVTTEVAGYSNNCEKIVRVLDDNGQPEIKNNKPRYRMFKSNAYLTVQYNVKSVKIAESENIYSSDSFEVKYDGTDIDINPLYFYC